jgi:mannitol-1-phosphate 5-dehydrogenase
MSRKKLLQFGAGKIGRSFIGQLFSRAGYAVVFVDIDSILIDALNKERRYRVEIKDIHPQTIRVENVRAVNTQDTAQVAQEVTTADIIATAVGPAALPHIYPTLAQGLLKRNRMGKGPVDIIICENLRDAARIFRSGLTQYLPEDFPLDSSVGLVETSIGKMVPIMSKQQREDPLLVFAESYNTLIVDEKGFKTGVPAVKDLEAKENMKAYVDRKAFIHNLGHAVTAYLGYLIHPEATFIWEVIEEKRIYQAAWSAMWESAQALIAEYPQEFNPENQKEHIEDLLRRFGNRALGDTIFRVGRDLPRKLSSGDRLIGALRLDTKHSISAPYTTLGTAAAMLFRAKGPGGQLFPQDQRFCQELYPQGVNYVLETVCGLDPQSPQDHSLMNTIKKAHQFLLEQDLTGGDWLTQFSQQHFTILA